MLKFALGQTVATRAAAEEMNRLGANPLELLRRHLALEQGCLDDEDHRRNVRAVEVGLRVFSAFEYSGVKFWVITEWDRSVTTVLLPEDY